MPENPRRPCTRCAVVGPHAGAICRRCSRIAGVSFDLAPLPERGELLPDVFNFVAYLHQMACASAVAFGAFIILSQQARGGVYALALLGALRFQAMRRTMRREALGWWTLALLALLDLGIALSANAPLLALVGVGTLALIAPQAVRQAAVEPPARGVPMGVEILRVLHVVLAAAILIAGIRWWVTDLEALLAMIAAGAQLVVPALVIGCGGRGWRWWVALCAFDVAGGLLALPWTHAGWIFAALGAGGMRMLVSDAARTWAHRGALGPPAELGVLAAVSLALRALGAGACALALWADATSGLGLLGVAYFSCGLLATLGTLGGERRCWLAWRGANLIDGAAVIVMAAYACALAGGGSSLVIAVVLLAAGTAVGCATAQRVLGAEDVQRFAAPPAVALLPARTPRRAAPRAR